jgi:hypothetical protein
MKRNFQIIVLTYLLFGALTPLPSGARAQGGLPLWTNRYNGAANGDDSARALVVDHIGNPVEGICLSPDLDVPFHHYAGDGVQAQHDVLALAGPYPS